MAEIDQLSISIKGEASRAERSIDGLISRLRTLNRSLDLGNLSNFTRQLREISSSASGIKGIAADIRDIANAGSALSKLTGFKTLNDEMKEAESEAKRLATSVADSLNFDSSKSKGYKSAVKDFAEVVNFQIDSLRKGKTESGIGDVYAGMIGSLQKTRAEFEDTYTAVRNFADGTKLVVDKTTLDDLSKMHDGLEEVKKALNGNISADGLENTANYFKELEEATGKHFDTHNFANAIEDLVEYLRDGSQKINQEAGLTAEQIQESLKMRGEDIAQAVRDFFDKAQTEQGQVKNPFLGVAEGLKSLQGVTLPDFSGLGTLSEGLVKLNDVKTGNLIKVAEAVKLLGESGNVTFNIGNGTDVSKVEQSLVVVRASLDDIKKLIESISGDIGQFAQLFGGIEAPFTSWSDAFKGIAIEVATVNEGLDKLRTTVSGLPEILASLKVGTNAEMGGQLLQAIGAFSELIQYADIAKTSIQNLSAQIDGLTGKVGNIPIKEELEKTKEKADETKTKLSELDQYVQDIFNRGFVQNGVSRELANTLTEIRELEQELSRMKERPEILDRDLFISFTNDLRKAKIDWEDFEREVTRVVKFADVDYSSLDETSRKLTEAIEKKKEYDRIISSMESGEVVTNAPLLAQAYKGSADAAKEIEKLEQSLGKASNKTKDVSKSSVDLLANLVALGHEIGNIANAFDRLGDKGITALKWMYKPVVAVANEYRERLSSIGDMFKSFSDNARKQLQKLSAFWKRSMKTFTFMLVRKAITAVLNEINDATQSLAIWSKQFGTIFNNSMSQITSNLSYMARAIVGAFEPLINAVVPIINALSDAVANAAARLGEFFAALTGQGYYMQAVRQVTDYADSVDKANKAQKNLIAGLDDLNIITTPTSTASGMDDVAAQWEKMDVSDSMKDWAQSVKDIAKRLFAPIKTAWDEAKDHVIGGFKYMVGEIGELAKSIGRDFMKVWEQPNTEKIFENLLHTVGYIEEGIGNLAKRFREAWDEGEKGLHIFENIRDIILIVTEHVRNMAKTFRDWADSLDFNPLLKAFENFTKAVQPLVDFLGNVIEDIWERVILRHWKWLIEEGGPHLLNTISRVIEAFNFEKIRKDLQPVMDAFETMRENIDTGLVDAFGNLGERVAAFMNSEDFTKFTQNVAWFMEQITAERVEKLFTALGDAVLDIAEALAKFVGSERFRDFMQWLFDRYDELSKEDIAGFIKGIAIAIGTFKFGAFAANKLSGFFKFWSLITSWRNSKKLVAEMKNLGKGLEKVGKGAETAKGAGTILSKLAVGLKAIATAGLGVFDIGIWSYDIKNLFDAFKGYKEAGDALDSVRQKYTDLYNSMNEEQQIEWLKALGVDSLEEAIEQAEKDFDGIPTNLWAGFKSGLSHYFGENGVGVIQLFKDAFGGVVGFVKGLFGIESPSKVFFEIAGYIAEGFFNGLIDGFANILSWLNENLVQPIINFFADSSTWLIEHGRALVQGFSDGIEEMKNTISDKWEDIKKSVVNIAENLRKDVSDKWEELKKNASDAWDAFKTTADEKWESTKKSIYDIAENLRSDLKKKWDKVKSEANFAWDRFKIDAKQRWENIRSTIHGKAEEIRSNLESKWGEVKQNAEVIWGNIKIAADTTWGDIKDSIVGFAKSASEEASGWFWNLVGWASDAFNGVVTSAGSIFSGLGSTISNAVGDLWSTAKGWGSNILSGLQNGIENSNGLQNVKRSVGLMADAVTTTWKKLTRTSSPSKLFKDFGEYLVEGLNIGIKENASNSADAVKKWFSGIESIKPPVFDFESAIPKNNFRMDNYDHVSTTASFDNAEIQASVRQGVADAIGGLILPYLSDIAQSSRETADKDFTIGTDAVGRAAQQYAKNYQTRTGRPAYGY